MMIIDDPNVVDEDADVDGNVCKFVLYDGWR